MALAGYPQTHNSPDPEVVNTENDTTQYEGPFSSIKILSNTNTDHVVLYIYLDSAGYNKATGDQVAGADYYIINALATDTLPGPIYGFRFHTDSVNDTSVIGYRYSTSIL
jgi:hypothetical protein